MRKYLYTLLCIATLASCHESLEEKAAREAEEFTKKNCPVQISQYIINDSMTFEKESRTIHYFYTITGKADTTAVNTPDMRTALIKGVKGATSIRTYKDAGFNFAYTYYSEKNKGLKLIDVRITPKEYNK